MTEPPGKNGAPSRGAPDQIAGRSRSQCRASRVASSPLSDDERIVLKALTGAARNGLPCPTADDLLELLPHRESASSTVEIMDRLEARGLISIERFQRGRQVTILATGAKTATPACTSPHWRVRPEQVPSPSPSHVARRLPVADEIFAAARRERKAPQDFLAELVAEAWGARHG